MADPSIQSSPNANPSPSQRAFEDALNTLDEPVSDTIKRDLMRIYNKLKIVVNPMQLGI